jgi:hypothetical protein
MSSNAADACVYCVLLIQGGWHRDEGSIPFTRSKSHYQLLTTFLRR